MSELVRVLHLDDSAADRELVRDALEQEHEGFEVVQAASREELRSRLAEGEYDVVLTDFSILGTDGLDVIDLVRAKHPHMPVIIVTGAGSETSAADSMKRGATDYVIKTPSEIRRLPVTIQSALKEVRSQAERRQAAKALRESEQRALRFSAVLEHSLNEIYMFDAETLLFVEVNQGARRNLGYSMGELRYMTPLDLKPEFAAESFAELVDPLRAGIEDKIQFAAVHRRKDGSLYPVEVHLQLMTTGQPVFVAIVLDITDRQRAEEALKEREKHFRLFCLSTGDCFWNWDMVTGAVERSSGFERAFGYQKHEIHPGVEWWAERIHPEDKKGVWKTFDGAAAGEQSTCGYEYRFRCRDDSYALIRDHVCFIRDAAGKAVRSLGVMRDITERKHAEEALRESEQRMELALRGADLGTWDWNVETGDVKFDERCVEVFGYSLDEVEPNLRTWQKLVHPEEMPEVMEALKAHLDGKTDFYETEYRLRHKSGKWIWVQDKGRVIERAADGRPLRACGTHRDITRHKRAGEERERLSVAIDQTAESVMITDAVGTIQYVNPAFAKITGYTRAEAIGQNPRILKSGKHDDAFYEEMWDTIGRGDTWRGRIVNRKKDGTLFTEEMIISPMRDASGRSINYVTVGRDVSEQLRLEQQLRQAQKLESVGRLAGGVAHDFNNMLGVILGRAEMALDRLEPGHPAHAELVEISMAAERSADLTRQLLAFARKQTIAPQVLDLNELLDGMLKMLRLLIGEAIDLVWRPAKTLWPVKVDPSQIDQIMANLCVNARDAIEDVGKVTIETRNTTLDKAYCTSHPGFVPGEFVLLAVSDNGCGMDKETLDRVYEPFFTTKELGKGTGLGLATVYGVVKQNNGFIDVHSEPGQGTAFRIYLPRHEAEAMRRQQEDRVGPAKRGRETILLVEDEPAILKTVAKMLEIQGYTVLTASAPAEAIRIAADRSGKIHLLLTDVIMPEMNGRDLAEKLLSRYPSLTALFMSGYTADAIASHGVLHEGVRFIQKPFTAWGLAAKVREALDSD